MPYNGDSGQGFLRYGRPGDPSSICGDPRNQLKPPYSQGQPICCAVDKCVPYTQNVVFGTYGYQHMNDPGAYPSWKELGKSFADCDEGDKFFCCIEGRISRMPTGIENALSP